MSTRCLCLGHCPERRQSCHDSVRYRPDSSGLLYCKLRARTGLEGSVRALSADCRCVISDLRYSIEPVIRGIHDGRGNFSIYAECRACDFVSIGDTAYDARRDHYTHCAKVHCYVLPESYGKVKVHDETLQQAIIAAMLYDLPLPEYDNHSGCIRQMLGDVIVCAQHRGNQPKIWMGVY